MITTPMVRLASTIVEFSTLGNMWRKITRVATAGNLGRAWRTRVPRRLRHLAADERGR